MEIELLLLSILAVGLFSGMELAFVSANRLEIELKKQQGGLLSYALSTYYEKPSLFLGTLLMGVNISLVIYSITMAGIVNSFLHPIVGDKEFLGLFIETVITTVVVLIVGEFIPKNIFMLNPNGFLNVLAIPFLSIYYILYIFVVFTVFIAKFLLKYLFGINYTEDNQKPIFSKFDLQDYVAKNIEGKNENQQPIDAELFENAIDLTYTKVRECMVTRTEIEAVEIDETLDEIRQQFIETKHSKLIVYKETIDSILGYFHHQDILKNRKKLWKMITVPEAMHAGDLLHQFIKERKTLAWVVDEFGGTAGIISLEDVMEEIFGEIRDEYDNDEAEQLLETQINENEYLFSGRLSIDHLNNTYDLQIPIGDYETLAGFIIANSGSIPAKSEVVIINHFEFTITDVSNTRINNVVLKVLKR